MPTTTQYTCTAGTWETRVTLDGLERRSDCWGAGWDWIAERRARP